MITEDFRIETRKLLSEYRIYKSLKERCLDDADGPNVMSTVEYLVNYSFERTKIIVKNMDQYTLHDGNHLFRVLNIMGSLIPEETLRHLSVPELMLLVLAAFLHDIGMAPSESEVKAWKGSITSEWDKVQNLKYLIFCDSKHEVTSEIEKLIEKKEFHRVELINNNLIAEYIRKTHADRAGEIINNEINIPIKYKDKDLRQLLIQLCLSHVKDTKKLDVQQTSIICTNCEFICLPYLEVILRIADILDFDSKRTPEVLFESLLIQNPISIAEWNKHRSIDGKIIQLDKIIFSAECTHPAIELSIKEFCQLIEDELIQANNILDRINNDGVRSNEELEYYRYKFPTTINSEAVKPKKDHYGKDLYQYHETRFTLNKNQIIDMLMGTKLYSDPRLALRELIQNSIDTCLVRNELENVWNNHSIFKPKLKISYLKDIGGEYYIEVDDNGMGMDIDIINNFYSKVGNSYYSSREFRELKSKNNIDFNPISQFGIGILYDFKKTTCSNP